MEAGGSRGEGIGLAVEFFGYGGDEPKVDADVAKVAGHFFNSKHVRFGLHTSVDLSPEGGMGALRWGVAIEDVLESIYHGFVVDKDVDRSLSAGGEVHDGQSLGDLGILGEAMNSGAVVHAVFNAVVDSVARPREKWYSLVGTGAVRGRVGPGPSSCWVKIGGVSVGADAFWGWSG